MPTYDYRCNGCGHAFELFQSMRDPVKKICPECGKRTLERLIGTGAALLFKGSGFYITDYRSESYAKSAAADQPASTSASSSSDAGVKAGTSANEAAKPATPGSGKPDSPTRDEAGASNKPASKPEPDNAGPRRTGTKRSVQMPALKPDRPTPAAKRTGSPRRSSKRGTRGS